METRGETTKEPFGHRSTPEPTDCAFQCLDNSLAFFLWKYRETIFHVAMESLITQPP